MQSAYAKAQRNGDNSAQELGAEHAGKAVLGCNRSKYRNTGKARAEYDGESGTHGAQGTYLYHSGQGRHHQRVLNHDGPGGSIGTGCTGYDYGYCYCAQKHGHDVLQ